MPLSLFLTLAGILFICRVLWSIDRGQFGDPPYRVRIYAALGLLLVAVGGLGIAWACARPLLE